ncbi:unnamed protein product [Angiostrongylus costaricensis]|uniref:m7GpppX diphosphatase n=1 Tax=Angiostrongylus costaricensis TaxID=334426 RepID=A0A158PKQ2_ANGCS|nr:unnamed protein product [Angiostrongylus costaricensis]
MELAEDCESTTEKSNVAGNGAIETQENAAQSWLRGATFREVLGSDVSHKSLFVLLSGVNGEQGVLLMNKSAFSEDANDINAILHSAELLEVMKNDIYGSYNAIVAKYRQEEKFIINETAEDYRTITVEYIEKFQMDLKWVYNILSKECEAERILFEDPDPYNGFILAPDIKWDSVSLENLYVLAMIHRRGVRLKYDAPASSTLAAVLLDDVINNLKIAPDYYRRATLSFTRKNSDKLLQMFREAGRCEA